MKRLFIGNLPFEASEGALRSWFAQAGVTVDSVDLIRDAYTGQPRGFGLVEIRNDDEAKRAIKTLDGKEFLDRQLAIDEARPRRGRGRRDRQS